ncbi:MAG: carboxypeptidase, partial [Pseudomonadota bacterium]
LSLYDVLILPDSSSRFSREIGRAAPIQEFVREGGVLVAISGSVDMLAGESYKLLSTKRENAAVSDDDASGGADDGEGSRAPGTVLESDEDYQALIRDTEARPEDVPGVLVKAVADPDHWLSAGYDTANVLVTGGDIYRPLNAADGANVFRFANADDLLLSGYLWEENQAQLAFKPFVMAERQGDGLVVGFTQSPVTRAYLNGLNLLMANAVLLGPARVAQ